MSKRFGQVEKDVAKLATLAATGKPLSGTRAKAVLKEIEELKPVLARFAARAAEKDEDKKVYGPKMCTKIQAANASFEAVVVTLTDMAAAAVASSEAEAAGAEAAATAIATAETERLKAEAEAAARKREEEAAAKAAEEAIQAAKLVELQALAETQRKQATARAEAKKREAEEAEAKMRREAVEKRAQKAKAAEEEASKARKARKERQAEVLAARKKEEQAAAGSSPAVAAVTPAAASSPAPVPPATPAPAASSSSSSSSSSASSSPAAATTSASPAGAKPARPSWLQAGVAVDLPVTSQTPSSPSSPVHQEWMNHVSWVCNADEPVITLVDITATWCGPCRRIAPAVSAIAAENPDVAVIKVDGTAHAQLVGSFGARSFPTFIIYLREKKVASFSGADEGKLRASLAQARVAQDELAMTEAIALSEAAAALTPGAAAATPAPASSSATDTAAAPATASAAVSSASSSSSGVPEVTRLTTDPDSIAVDPDTLAPAGTAGDTLARALRQLREQCSKQEYLSAVEALIRSATKMQEKPDEPKFRRVRATNASFRARVGRFAAGEDCIQAMGFAKADEPVSDPPAEPAEGAQATVETELVYRFPADDEAAKSRLAASLRLLNAILAADQAARDAAPPVPEAPTATPALGGSSSLTSGRFGRPALPGAPHRRAGAGASPGRSPPASMGDLGRLPAGSPTSGLPPGVRRTSMTMQQVEQLISAVMMDPQNVAVLQSLLAGDAPPQVLAMAAQSSPELMMLMQIMAQNPPVKMMVEQLLEAVGAGGMMGGAQDDEEAMLQAALMASMEDSRPAAAVSSPAAAGSAPAPAPAAPPAAAPPAAPAAAPAPGDEGAAEDEDAPESAEDKDADGSA